LDTEVRSKAFEEFTAAAGAVMNPEIAEWKEQGGGVVGYFCSHVPTEVLTAAGLLPFRMRGTGSTATELSDAFFSNINCSFVRHTFNLALQGDYDFLDGLVCVNSCDHVRRVYDNWKRNLTTPFLRIISMPKKVEDAQVGWYRDEVTLLKDAVEKHFRVVISDEQLWEAIRLHNRTRRLQRVLYELRKSEAPPLTGAQTLAVMVAGTAMPRRRYNELLEALLESLRGVNGQQNYRARLMVVGGELDDPGYLEVIEEQGGLVVADALCFGSKAMWNLVDEEASDPTEALARYYIQGQPSCPRMHGDQPRRVAFLMDMVREFRVDGVVGERMMFCDLWCVEHYMNDLDLKEAGVPFISFDREYNASAKGQLRTRIQAFLETMGK